MGLDELKKAIDDCIGLTSEIEPYLEKTVFLTYKSPTGVKLFSLRVSDYRDGGWQFAGTSEALPNSWLVLCHIHNQAE